MKRAMGAVLPLLLIVSSAWAQKTGSTVQKIELTATALGKAESLEARALKGWSGPTEFLAVRVRAAMENGEVIRVLVDTASGPANLPLGRITILDGAGELQLSRTPFGGTLPIPISEIEAVRLVNAAGVLAEGSF